MMRRHVRSDNIASIGYDPKAKVLEVEFHYHNLVYQYNDVPYKVHQGLLDADSVGKYFNAEVRPKYKGVLVKQ